MRVLGGREIHPVNVKVGGFYRVPTRAELAPVAEDLKQARDLAVGLVRWVASFPFPDFERDYEFVALRHPDEYPFNEGRIVSNRGIDIDIADYDTRVRGTARRAFDRAAFGAEAARRLSGRATRPLRPEFRPPAGIVQALAARGRARAGLPQSVQSIIVRAVELVYACEEALRMIAAYEPPAAAAMPVEPRAGIGFGCTEAPRGICWHRYEFDADGTIRTRPHRAADLAEPAEHRGRSCAVATPLLDQSDDVDPRPLRADHPQLRSLHLLLGPFPQAVRASAMTEQARCAAQGAGGLPWQSGSRR